MAYAKRFFKLFPDLQAIKPICAFVINSLNPEVRILQKMRFEHVEIGFN